MKSILITGGCGFIGSNLAIALKKEGYSVACFDNLSRRGSEILMDRIKEHGCDFIYGDIRNYEDFSKLKGQYNLMLECSAEPSVLVGSSGEDAKYMINNNLVGSLNCFEFCRKRKIAIIFMSTSRVYPYNIINNRKFEESLSRYEYADTFPCISKKGISTEFQLNGYRSLYGATKLASEFILKEYSINYSLPAIINRCGIIAGPWQLGKVDQGVFTHWLSSHFYKKNLQYIGFGGKGKQVRDLLHINDIIELIKLQIKNINKFKGDVFNAGGASFSNLSLIETTKICEDISSNKVKIIQDINNRPADIIWYITNNGNTEKVFSWKPTLPPKTILTDIFNWLKENEILLKKILN
ncbi:MAG: hypothetical protein A2X08_00615 [Bacteroidetes bacterium GWA2_32_17]|nr:MAG: hypothetical protein A2X08_00615 [Bacteroidetes bacterium GWA2_32_17]